MSSVNVQAREVSAKIVFYGPGLSGKTTTLRRIYESVRPAHRGEMMSLATEGDRTLFFDFLPVKVERVGDCAVRLALYTVPGQVFYNATRKLVLQGADGVVFVADSQPEAMDNNRESLQNLEENLFEQGIRLEKFPLVIQYNKRDLPKALPVDELRGQLNPRGAPDFETSAMRGQGVLDTLKAITRLVIKDLRTKRIVPPPRTQSQGQVPAVGAGLEAQLSAHLRPGLGRPAPTISAAPAPMPTHPVAQQNALARGAGPLLALCPNDLADYAKAAEQSFAGGDHAGCIRACHEAVRRTLGLTGEASLPAQAYFLKLDGGDLLRLQGLLTKNPASPGDAAFAVYVAMQAFTRAAAVNLGGGE